jgi:hypothetical protein
MHAIIFKGALTSAKYGKILLEFFHHLRKSLTSQQAVPNKVASFFLFIILNFNCYLNHSRYEIRSD